jgi:hypothetical protein
MGWLHQDKKGSVVRALGALIAVLLTMAGSLATMVPSAQAAVGQFQQKSTRTGAAASRPLAISITGMTPTTARPDSTVTLHGTLANHTGSALSGITVQALTSPQPFGYPDQMTAFSDGTGAGASALPLQQAGLQYQVPGTVPNGATVRWSVSFQAGFFYVQFGVFPVQVQASAPGISATAAASTFLPFWPGGTAAAQTKGLQAAWVWPLLDTPQQGACEQTLATSELASSVASGGRLSTLLGAGATWAQADQLTWEIDPALLSDVSVLTHSYFTQGNAACSGRVPRQPVPAAGKWLSQLRASVAGGSAFLTPYANVDVAALSHSGLDANIEDAYRVGDALAGQILPNTFGKNDTGTGDGTVLKVAWPADGQADAEVLTSLADDHGISTVVLSGDGVDALGRTVSGVGTPMSLLFANSRLTSLLGTASATASAADQFALTQDFLAQTAMIAAEYPGAERSLVIAPPTGWNPSPTEASALLSITSHAPWLHPAALSALSAAAAKLPSATHVKPKQVSGAELSEGYLDKLTPVASSLSLFKNLLYRPSAEQLDALDAAFAATESSAWRGRGSYGGWLAMALLGDYLNDSERKVQMVASKKILLAGQSGETPVSVVNGLHVPVQVQVTALTPTGSQIQLGSSGKMLVQGEGSQTVHLKVHSSTIGTTTVQLQLATQDGSPLTWTVQPLSVEVTRFGRTLLIGIGAALGILVLTSAYQLRRKRLAGAKSSGTDETAEAGGTG